MLSPDPEARDTLAAGFGRREAQVPCLSCSGWHSRGLGWAARVPARRHRSCPGAAGFCCSRVILHSRGCDRARAITAVSLPCLPLPLLPLPGTRAPVISSFLTGLVSGRADSNGGVSFAHLPLLSVSVREPGAGCVFPADGRLAEKEEALGKKP